MSRPVEVVAWRCGDCERLHGDEGAAEECCYDPPATVAECRAAVSKALSDLLSVAFQCRLPAPARDRFVRFRRTFLRHHERQLRLALAREAVSR